MKPAPTEVPHNVKSQTGFRRLQSGILLGDSLILNNLVQLYSSQRRYEEAEPLYLEALER
ncbi:tetratricopeptide repeat protein [Coleofasciculus sp. G2-EDA-02]|uniref:tetratricopeptide repeat protein n=1 Tax=Coleofasciculus sp. G2-EDA-02 TaxID=3069529 RepID=UPI00406332B8